MEECERKEGVGEGSSTFTQLSLTYMKRGDNNKCLCVRALKAAQLFCSHNGLLPTPGPELTYHHHPSYSQNYISLMLFMICLLEEQFISWSNSQIILSISHYKHLHLALVLVSLTWHSCGKLAIVKALKNKLSAQLSCSGQVV